MTDNELIAEKRRHYHRVHQWLQRNHGKACKCENPSCPHTSDAFEWALRKGFTYEKSTDHFIQLCVVCHRKYDLEGKSAWNKGLKTGPQSEITKQKRAIAMTGKRQSESAKQKMSATHSGKTLSFEHRQKLSKAKIKHGRYLNQKPNQIHYEG